MTRAVRTLLTDLVDYAGLFPPAKLAMQPAVEEYNRCRVGENEFMLGRFICPASRLEEFSAAAAPFMPGTFATSGYQEQVDAGPPWLLSVLLDADSLHHGLDAIDAFNARHSAPANGQAMADAVEIRVSDVNQIDSVLDELPEDLYPFFEFPVAADCRGYVAALAGNKAAAKIRTGGVTAPAFPTAAEIAGFLVACAKADVPFKATAGLHHPLRSAHALTYEPGSATCTMHGFLNVFIAAALVKCKGLDVERVEALLLEEDPAAFKFGDEFVSWQAHGLERLELAKAREAFALSFGSCSFDEPVADLSRLGWL
jgi:hypothetical protein